MTPLDGSATLEQAGETRADQPHDNGSTRSKGVWRGVAGAHVAAAAAGGEKSSKRFSIGPAVCNDVGFDQAWAASWPHRAVIGALSKPSSCYRRRRRTARSRIRGRLDSIQASGRISLAPTLPAATVAQVRCRGRTVRRVSMSKTRRRRRQRQDSVRGLCSQARYFFGLAFR